MNAYCLRTGQILTIRVNNGRFDTDVAVDAESAGMTWAGPGWIDVQVNGFAGQDVNSGALDVNGFERMTRALHGVGVSRYLPTVITAAEHHMATCLRAAAQARAASSIVKQAVPGLHLEGPFISPEEGARGAHPLEHVLDPEPAVFDRLQEAADGLIRLITLAPERPGALNLIDYLQAQGVVVAIGHSLADDVAIREAVDAGARLSTHLGNGIPRLLPRHPNLLWAQLADDRLYASVIFDGHHLPESAMKVFRRVKGDGRLILTSDAVSLAGCSPGVYDGQVGGTVELHSNSRLTMLGSEYLAGSASSLADGVTVAIHRVGVSVEQAISMVTSVPAELLGLEDRNDHTVFRVRKKRVEVQLVAIDGEVVFDGRSGQGVNL
jgi:N-acetylglucosamine-6-phosphate deacetylase